LAATGIDWETENFIGNFWLEMKVRAWKWRETINGELVRGLKTVYWLRKEGRRKPCQSETQSSHSLQLWKVLFFFLFFFLVFFCR
jgi:hypothetical protein